MGTKKQKDEIHKSGLRASYFWKDGKYEAIPTEILVKHKK